MKRTLVFQASGVTALLLLLAAAPSHSQAQPSSMTEDAAVEACAAMVAAPLTDGILGPTTHFKLDSLKPEDAIPFLEKTIKWHGMLDERIGACVQDTLNEAKSPAQADDLWKQRYADLKAHHCKDATQKLKDKGQLGNLQTLVKNDCPQLYKLKWLKKGTGKENAKVCDPPFRAIRKAKVIEHSKRHVSLGCATTP